MYQLTGRSVRLLLVASGPIMAPIAVALTGATF